jgi:tetratricopeptide (TPR) repeat protein
MTRGRAFFVLVLVALGPVCAALAQQSLAVEKLFSPSNARMFYKLAYELYILSEPDSKEADLAMILLDVALNLDNRAGYIFPDILNLCSQFVEKDYTPAVDWAFKSYTDDKADLEVTKRAVRYLLEKLNTRKEREEKLISLLKDMEEKNPVLASELMTQLGLLSVEKGDAASAIGHLIKAYNLNTYNKLAFAKLVELNKRAGQKMLPATYAMDLRLAMGANPLNIKAVFAFAQFMEKQGLYDIAASAYEYSAQLFNHLYPKQSLPASIYLPWALASYNTQRGQGRCLELARQIRQGGQFDIVLEVIAGSAARKIGDNEQSRRILEAAGQKAERMLGDGAAAGDITAEQLGWFCCFGWPDTKKALAWANRAYSANPDSVATKSILAYALAINKQTQLAAEMVGDLWQRNQIAALTLAMVQLAGEDNASAIETLKTAVAMDPGSLAGQKANTLLTENGSEYVADANPEMLMAALRNQFGKRIVPKFRTVDEIISAKLSLGGSEFFYGAEFGAKLVVKNESTEAVVISQDGIFKGGIRVDADVRGDIKAHIPNLITKKFRPSAAIEPGYYAAIPLDLMTGSLRRLLLTHPQASVKIEFTVYLDPIEEADGKVRSAIRGIGPVRTVIKRPGVVITRKYLMQRLDVLAKGQVGQKLRAAELFVGLLMEQYAMAESGTSYQLMHVEQTLLIDAVRKSLADEDWQVKLQTMAAMLPFPVAPDYDLTRAVSDNLGDSNWPVRVMALYLLSSLQGDAFKPVLDWTAKYDPVSQVRNMAVALGADAPQVNQPPEVTPEPQQKQ